MRWTKFAKGLGVSKLGGLIERAKNLWVTRSLAVGAVSTALDLALGGTLLWFGAPTRVAAMSGTLFGSLFSYFANRDFAFRDRDPTQSSFWRFALITGTASAIHAQFVVWFRTYGLPYVAAKMAADVIVYSVGQLLLLRYVVFPKKLAPTPQPTAPPDGGPSMNDEVRSGDSK